MKHIKQFPHCDSRVLHAPGECKYCDEHPEWQELREVWDINFTGKNDPDKMICPAERHRSIDVINRWHGNVAQTENRCDGLMTFISDAYGGYWICDRCEGRRLRYTVGGPNEDVNSVYTCTLTRRS